MRFSYFSAMNTLHRVVGGVNLFFILLIALATSLPWAVIMAGTLGMLLIGALILVYLIAVVWGVRNAFHYWGGPPKLTIMDHVLLAAGVLHAIALVVGLALFIYIGEN